MKHLLSIEDLNRAEIEAFLTLADAFVEVNARSIPKVPALRGKTVVSLFYEDSTRTRMSFETAARRLSADTMTFSVGTSSVKKGESLRDTVETIAAFGIDAIVVRHKSSGVPQQITQWSDASVINAGDGWHQHPTQALLDAYTIRSRFGSLEGRRIAIVGDIKHSRVARSDIDIFTKLGAEVTLVAPPTLLPAHTDHWPATVTHDFDSALEDLDVCYLLRMQNERMAEALVPSMREYTACFGLTARRLARLSPETLIMHPGPMNRGVEISPEAAEHPNSVIIDQVANGVSVRMAVLFRLLAADTQLDAMVGTAPTGAAAAAAARPAAGPATSTAAAATLIGEPDHG
jgi:aspartate carbamoyltransferase catalytic subunit